MRPSEAGKIHAFAGWERLVGGIAAHGFATQQSSSRALRSYAFDDSRRACRKRFGCYERQLTDGQSDAALYENCTRNCGTLA